jgi:hypothetical protein
VVVELNRALFRRLVWLYLASVVAFALSVVFMAFDSKFSVLEREVDGLIARSYGAIDDLSMPVLIAMGVGLVLILIYWLASTIGLLFFKRWARFGFWASLLPTAPMFLVVNVYPALTTGAHELTLFISSGLFGAILLMAYASGAGDDWFGHSERQEKDA